jgi:hypothetical protein
MKPIPRQKKGAQSATRYQVKTKDIHAARKLFEMARLNLLQVNRWHELAGSGSAIFSIVEQDGEIGTECVKEGNYLRISIPGIPGSPAGDGDDWVKVENIIEHEDSNSQFIAVRVRPTSPPGSSSAREKTAHFFSDDATSTFYVERKGRIVMAAVYGRNEMPNIKTKGFLSKMRNLVVAIGAMIGLNKSQWKNLVKGLVNKNL